jgi:secondary thiamine-phosphate synthase enzyme
MSVTRSFRHRHNQVFKRSAGGYDPRVQEKTFRVSTTAREQIVLITCEVDAALSELTRGDGICTIIVPHTTCAISVNENADPDVLTDLTAALRAVVPNVRFAHGEGNSDAHFLSMLIGTSLTWPYRNGRLVLGTWQGVYFVELDGPRERKVTVYVS